MRTNKKTVTKYYDEETINGWAVNYQYEVENGDAPAQISVNGSKEGKAFSINKSAANMNVSFAGGADFDSALVDGVSKEIAKILASNFKK